METEQETLHKKELQNSLDYCVMYIAELNLLHNYLISKKSEQEQIILNLLGGFHETLLQDLNSGFLEKERFIKLVLQDLEKHKVTVEQILQGSNQCRVSASVLKKTEQIKTLCNDFNSILNLDCVVPQSSNVHDLCYIKTSTVTPKQLKYYVTKKTQSSLLLTGDIISIKVIANPAIHDPLLITFLECILQIPQNDEFKTSSFHGQVLKDCSYEFTCTVNSPGKYIVRVLLYGVDIMDSPSFFEVIEQNMEESSKECPSSVLLEPNFPLDVLKRNTSIVAKKNEELYGETKPSAFFQCDSSSSFSLCSLKSENSENELGNCSLMPRSSNISQTTETKTLRKPHQPQLSVILNNHCCSVMNHEQTNTSTELVANEDSVHMTKRHNSAFEIQGNTSGLSTSNLDVSSPKVQTNLLTVSAKSPKFKDINNLGESCEWKLKQASSCAQQPLGFWRNDKGWMLEGKHVKSHFMWKTDQSLQLRFPIGVSPTPDEHIVVCDTGNHRVLILNNEGKLVKSFGKEGHGKGEFFRPSAVVAFDDRKIAVKDDHRIQVFSPEYDYLWSCYNGNLHKPYGLAIDGHGRLVTLDVGPKSYLYFFSPNGHLIRRDIFEPLHPLQPDSKCRFLDADEKGVAVVDLGLNCVYVTDFSGKLIRQFGSKGRKPGMFFDPAGISIDENHNYFVADSKNSRVQVFDCEGNFKTCVDFNEHPIHRPSDMCLTRTGKLLVLNYIDHFLSAYDLKI